MFPNYLKIACRNFIKKRFFSFVNVAGLAIGMAACFFVYQYVFFERSFDKFHQNAERLYRIGIQYSGEAADQGSAANHPAVGPAMKMDFSEIQDFARLFPFTVYMNGSTALPLEQKTNTMVSYDDQKGNLKVFHEENIYIADASLAQIFTMPFLRGDPSLALNEPNCTVISSSMAEKYFGATDPVGKILKINGQLPLTVTGVFKDIPANSHIHFKMLISLGTLGDKFGNDIWTWPECYNYVLLKPEASVKDLQKKFPAFVERHMGNIMKYFNFRCTFFITPVTDIHLTSNFQYEPQAQGSGMSVNLLALIGAFILLIAWINYVNLSTARSLERAKEVGLRKIVGAGRWHLIVQFTCEALLANFVALILTAMIILVSFAYLNELFTADRSSGMLVSPIWRSGLFWKSAVLIFISGVLVTGTYPAFVLSGFRPASIIKGKFTQTFKTVSVRKVLVAIQFGLSILLIAGTITVFRQLSFVQKSRPGYNKDRIIVVRAPTIFQDGGHAKFNFLKNEVRQNPSFRGISFSSDIPGKALTSFNSIWRSSLKETSSVPTFMMEIDESFIPSYEIPIAAGRNIISRDSIAITKAVDAKILVNETLARRLGYKTNEEVLHQRIAFRPEGWVAHAEIVGVVKDYHQRTMREAYDPIVYYYPNWNKWKYVSIKTGSDNIEGSLAFLEQQYKNIFPGNSFEYLFLDDYFSNQYKADKQFVHVFTLFTIVAIFITCLGLLGLSSLMVQIRTREIGIRKVLGASISGLLLLFSKDFIKLILWSTIVAVPFAYFAADAWLSNYAFRVRLNWPMFFIPSLLLMIVSLLTVGIQSWKTAVTNPVKTLRTE